jgi:hypothetical protein
MEEAIGGNVHCTGMRRKGVKGGGGVGTLLEHS